MGSTRQAIRDGLLTLLDALIIAAASAAAVIVLGGGGRHVIFGIPLSIRSPLNPATAAAVLSVARLALGGRRRMLPSVPLRDPMVLEHERQRFAAPAPWTRAARIGAAAAMLSSIVWILPHLAHPRRVPDFGDPVFSAWRTAAFAHQLLTDPRHLFDGNIFFPTPHTLAYSDATILQGTLAAPFVAAGLDPLLVSNAIMLCSFPLVALAWFALGWRLTGDARAACLAGLLGAAAIGRFDQYSHVEMQFTPFIPLAALSALTLAAAPTWRSGARLGALIVGQFLSGMYLGLMLMLWLAPLGAILLLAWARRPWRPVIEAVAAAGLVVVLGVGALAIPYLGAQESHGGWTNRVIGVFSASGSDYVKPNRRVWLAQALHVRSGENERSLYPGLVTPLLAAAALPAASGAGIASIVAGALAVDWSLGRKGLTYDDILKRVPAFSGMRVPARFSVLAVSSLIMLASMGSARLLRFADRRRLGAYATCLIAAFALLVDLRPSFPLLDVPAEVPGIYASVTPASVLAELPMGNDPNILYMYFSTRHWARLLNGYSGFYPGTYLELFETMKRFPAPDTIDAVRAAGATHLSFNCALEPRTWRCGPTIAILDARPDLEAVGKATWQGKEVRLYRFR